MAQHINNKKWKEVMEDVAQRKRQVCLGDWFACSEVSESCGDQFHGTVVVGSTRFLSSMGTVQMLYLSRG
jgi:hypothetical protein